MFLFLTRANIDRRCIETLLLFQIQARIHCKSYNSSQCRLSQKSGVGVIRGLNRS